MDIVQLITDIDAFVWGPPMIVILLGSHLFLTFRTGFIQRKLPTAIKLSVTKDPDAPGDISQFGALCTALSATIGTSFSSLGISAPSALRPLQSVTGKYSLMRTNFFSSFSTPR